jgi:hypothetical protein
MEDDRLAWTGRHGDGAVSIVDNHADAFPYFDAVYERGEAKSTIWRDSVGSSDRLILNKKRAPAVDCERITSGGAPGPVKFIQLNKGDRKARTIG